jgi:site-specific recombinase XerD
MGRKKATINFNLKSTSDPESEELIYFISIVKGTKVKISTGQKALVKTWNKELQRCNTGSLFTERENRHSNKVNKFLDWLLEATRGEWDAFKRSGEMYQTPDDFKRRIKGSIERKIKGIEEEQQKQQIKPLEFFQKYVEKKDKIIVKQTGTFTNERTKAHHQTVLKRITAFMAEMRLNDDFGIFNKRFETLFEGWAYTSRNYRSNTIPATFSVLKVWLNEAEREGLITDKSFHEFKSKSTDVDNIYLTSDEIKKIYNLDIPTLKKQGKIDEKSFIETTKDLFVISCLTGLRLGDWGQLNHAVWNFSGEVATLSIITQKTKEPVIIPLNPIVVEIYNKYNGVLPNKIDKTASLAHLTHLGMLAEINDEILYTEIRGGKSTTVKYKKYQLIKNHTGRRSFATNMYLKGAPTIGIMKITGHTTEANFLKYIKVSKEENAMRMASFV